MSTSSRHPNVPSLPSLPHPETETVVGQVSRVVFSGESGYGVVIVKRSDNDEEACLVGNLSGVMEGVEIEAEGGWTEHPRFGRQFKVTSAHFLLPKSRKGIQKYLASGVLPGIHEVTAQAIVKCFGDKTLEILDKAPGRLIEVPGIGKKRLKSILESWQKVVDERDQQIFFLEHGISSAMAQKIIQKYAPRNAAQLVQNNPFRLERDMEGIGFLTCDRVASSLGFTPDSTKRLSSGITYTLRQASLSGHVCLPLSQLLQQSEKLLQVPRETLLKNGYGAALQNGQLLSLQFPGEAEPLCYIPDMELQERQLARLINTHLLQKFPPLERLMLPPSPPDGLVLNPEQEEAVKVALVSPISIVTGGPGVGKTTVLRRLVDLAHENFWKVQLAAPTGRAAKRLAESTGDKSASTLHRLLKYDPKCGQFTVNEDNPLECDLLVVDEVSMLDLALAHALFQAIPDKTRVVLVGDKDQLPSVSPGAVLHDLLECHKIPVVALTRIYRQAEGSRIIDNAHAINQGQIPDLTNPAKGSVGEFYFYPCEAPQKCQEFLTRLCAKDIPNFFGYNAMEDIQVLTPMRKGECGTIALNQALQAQLNPPSPEKPEFTLAGEQNRIFRLGDRVMQTKNNYENQVFNGDMGRIVSLDQKNRTFEVAFDKHTVEYKAQDCTQLLHAYAVTIHKSQGSEFPAVVTPLLTQHYVMLQRNLLYTAVTRAKNLFILLGTPSAVKRAVENDTPLARFTRLTWRILNPAVYPTPVTPLSLAAAKTTQTAQ